MKKYRLLKDLPGVKAGLIIREGDNLAYVLDIENRDWFEEIKERWEPRIGAGHFYIDCRLNVTHIGNSITEDIGNLNCFRTKELAEAAAKEVRAALDKYHERIGE